MFFILWRKGRIFNLSRPINCFRGKFYHSCAPISTGFALRAGYNRAMKTVYLDELFVLNLVIDYFLLLATARLCALPFRRRRFAGAAAIGALWCCLGLFPRLSFLTLPVMHPVLALAMTVTAFGAERHIFRCFFAFLGVSALFGGAVCAAGLYAGNLPGSGRLVKINMRILAVSFALCWALVSLVFHRSAKNARRRVRDVTVERNGRAVRFRALEDTGNGLYDPITGCAALVAEADALAELFPDQAAALRGPPIDAVERIPGARLIPYTGIDGRRRLLLAFRPERVTVDGEPRTDLLAAVTPAGLGGDGSYQAVI